MGLFRWFTHSFMGKGGIMNETVVIKDGIVIEEGGSPIEETKEIPEMKEETVWEFPEAYVEDMISIGLKVRTAKEYAIDLKSFGVCLDTITVEQIMNRIKGLAESNQRRKITALRSFAKWRLRQNEAQLFITLSEFKLKR